MPTVIHYQNPLLEPEDRETIAIEIDKEQYFFDWMEDRLTPGQEAILKEIAPELWGPRRVHETPPIAWGDILQQWSQRIGPLSTGRLVMQLFLADCQYQLTEAEGTIKWIISDHRQAWEELKEQQDEQIKGLSKTVEAIQSNWGLLNTLHEELAELEVSPTRPVSFPTRWPTESEDK